jgi:hypothetical protein
MANKNGLFSSLIEWSTSWFIPRKRTDLTRKTELDELIENEEQNKIDFSCVAQKFIKKLYHPSSSDLLRYLQSFITVFNELEDPQQFDGLYSEGNENSATYLNLPDSISNNNGNFLDNTLKRIEELHESFKGNRETSSPSDHNANLLHSERKAAENANSFTYQLRTHSRLIRERKLTSPEEIQSVRGQLVQDFIMTAYSKFLVHPFWKHWRSTQQQREELRECIERFILSKIIKKAYVPNHYEDARFLQLVSTLQFLEPKHLGLKILIERQIIEQCGELLIQMNFFILPRNKLNCISHCCVLIFEYLQKKLPKGDMVNAELFLDALTYIVLQTNPPHLLNNVRYVNDYLSDGELTMGESGYFFSSLCIVLNYIKAIGECPLRLSLSDSTDSNDANKLSTDSSPLDVKEHILKQTTEKKILLQSLSSNPSAPDLTSKETSTRFFSFISSFLSFVTKQKEIPSDRSSRPLDIKKEMDLEKQFQDSFSETPPNDGTDISQLKKKQTDVTSVCESTSQIGVTPSHSIKETSDSLQQVSDVLNSSEEFRKRYKFWNYTVDDLKLEDLTELLAEYKRLVVVEYTQLKKKSSQQK